MVDPMDNIARQARQGSVAAIIQVLNEKLADDGIRTRAMFAKGMLQLLCEAATPEQLEQESLVVRVQQILEGLSPRGIRRVKINSRIVCEQQLLWLDEISREPEKLLWAQEIVLKQPNWFVRTWQDWQDRAREIELPKTQDRDRQKGQQVFWRGLLGGLSLAVLLFVMGWTLDHWLNLGIGDRLQTALSNDDPDTDPADQDGIAPDSEEPAAIDNPSEPDEQDVNNDETPAPEDPDTFVQAVRLAEQAVADGQSANSAADWLDLASRWQRASDLMAEVDPEDPRYTTAQDRVVQYRENSRTALQEAENWQE